MVAPSTSMGAGVVADCAGGVTTHRVRGEHMPVTKGPVDIGTAALDAGAAGGWMVAPGGYDNLAANPTTGVKEDAIGIPPVVRSGGRWRTCSQLYVSSCLVQWGFNSSPGHDNVCTAQG